MSIGNLSIPCKLPTVSNEYSLNVTLSGSGGNLGNIEQSSAFVHQILVDDKKAFSKYLVSVNMNILNSSDAKVSTYDASASCILDGIKSESKVKMELYQYSTKIATSTVNFLLGQDYYRSKYILGIDYFSGEFVLDAIRDLSNGTYKFKAKFAAVPISD